MLQESDAATTTGVMLQVGLLDCGAGAASRLLLRLVESAGMRHGTSHAGQTLPTVTWGLISQHAGCHHCIAVMALQSVAPTCVDSGSEQQGHLDNTAGTPTSSCGDFDGAE
jgi:hypothetical protein